MCDIRRHVGINSFHHTATSLTEIAARNKSVAAKYVETLAQSVAEGARGANYGQLADFYYVLARKVDEGETDLFDVAGIAVGK